MSLSFLPKLYAFCQPQQTTAAVCAAIGLVTNAARLFAATGDENWDARFYINGADNRIDALTNYGGSLYAGGQFQVIGSVAASGIARWDGTQWSPVGGGVNGNVAALLVSGGNLYVGGGFTRAGNVATTNVARWDGSQWHSMGQLGSGPSSGVYALTELNGDIYAGGGFTAGAPANYLARWNGSTWTNIGTGVNGAVYALHTLQNYVYAGGGFSQAGGLSFTRGIARWDGLNWSPLGQGLNSGATVYALGSRGINLYVGGSFSQAGGISAPSLALWYDDTITQEWQSLNATGTTIYGLKGIADRLYIGGRFSSIGGTNAVNITLLNATGWQRFSTGLTGPGFGPQVSAIEEFGGDVFGGGTFPLAGDVPIPNIARWDGAQWKNAGPTNGLGFDNVANALALVGTNIHVFGSFTRAGAGPVTGAARWTGNGWQQMAGGLPALSFGRYYAVNDGTNVYVGGPSDVKRWDGSAWTTLGFGASGPVAISGTNLYAVLYSFGGKAIARWTGSTWQQLGSNFVNTLTPEPLIQGLGVTNGEIIATGYFQSVGTNAALNIAKWDGNQWAGLGAGINPPNFSSSLEVAFLGSEVLVGTLCNLGTNRILRWNGSSWSTFPGTFTKSDGSSVWLLKILVAGNQLYVGGRFTHVDGVEVNGLAHWDGSQWRAFGSGLGGVVYDLALRDGKLYAVGDFTRAGTKGSSRFAVWSGVAAAPAIPALSLGQFGGLIRLSWPTDVTNVLQRTPNLAPSNWQPFTATPTTNGNQRVLDVAPTNTSGFFRLN